MLATSMALLIQNLSSVNAAYSIPFKEYDFIELAEGAEWSSGTPTEGETIEFGGPDTDDRGFAMYKDNVVLNDGKTYSKILETHPRWEPHGWIMGAYSNIYIPGGGATLYGKVGFIQGGTAGKVKIEIRLGDSIVLTTFDLEYADGVRSFEVDVPNTARGNTYTLKLIVDAGESSGQDWVAWAELYMTVRYEMIVSLEPDSLDINRGESGAITVHVTGDYPEEVGLSASDLPSGVTASFNPPSGTPPFDSTLTLTASETADVGVSNVKVRASHAVKVGGLWLTYISDYKTLALGVTGATAAPPVTTTTTPTPSVTVSTVTSTVTSTATETITETAGASTITETITETTTVRETTTVTGPVVTRTVTETVREREIRTETKTETVTSTVTSTVTQAGGLRCLIATAAFGSDLAPQVQVLRGFRDGFVMKTFAGRNFMNVFNAFYYSWSPYVARAEHENEVLRSMIRASIYPLLSILEFSRSLAEPLSATSELAVLLAGLVASSLIGLIYFAPPFIIVALILKRRAGKISATPIYPAISLLFGLILFALAEVTALPTLMMISSSIIVLSCIALAVTAPTKILKALLK